MRRQEGVWPAQAAAEAKVGGAQGEGAGGTPAAPAEEAWKKAWQERHAKRPQQKQERQEGQGQRWPEKRQWQERHAKGHSKSKKSKKGKKGKKGKGKGGPKKGHGQRDWRGGPLDMRPEARPMPSLQQLRRQEEKQVADRRKLLAQKEAWTEEKNQLLDRLVKGALQTKKSENRPDTHRFSSMSSRSSLQKIYGEKIFQNLNFNMIA